MSVGSAAAAAQRTDRQQSSSCGAAVHDDRAATAEPRPPNLGPVHTVVTLVTRRVTEARESSSASGL